MAFVGGRLIIDAIIIAVESIDDYILKKRKGYVIKVDFEKTCDKVNWEYPDHIMLLKGFGERWRKWITVYCLSSNFSIMINGRPWGKIRTTRGIRQGDPLPPFFTP